MSRNVRWMSSAMLVAALVAGTSSLAAAATTGNSAATPTPSPAASSPSASAPATPAATPTTTNSAASGASSTPTASATPTPSADPGDASGTDANGTTANGTTANGTGTGATTDSVTAPGPASAPAATGPSEVSYIVLPHPDDEFETLGLEGQTPGQYKVFITLTQGEDTVNCVPSLYAIATIGLSGHGLPNPAPDGQGTKSCSEARLGSWVTFFQQLSRTDTSLPGDFGDPTTVGPFPANGVALSHTEQGGPPILDTSATVWVDQQHRGALIAFDLGDRGITPAKAAWAVKTVMANRAAFGLDTTLPNYSVVGAYSNSQYSGCAPYLHPDHLAMADALRTTDFGVVFQATATCATNPSTVETTALSSTEMNAVYDQQTRRGAFWDAYAWLDTPSFDTVNTQSSMFMQLQSFDSEFTHYRTARVQGASRYDTSVAISQQAFPTGAPVVYLASGASYPDALSAAAAAAHQGGPLLLVPPSGLTAELQAEIRRLAPKQIVVVGGTAALPASVFSQVQTLAPSVTRVAGANRYATSQAVMESAFGSGPVPVVYVATGSGYADALSATSAAAAQGGAVLLIPGAAATDAGSLAALAGVDAQRVVIVGGSNAVSGAMMSSISAQYPTTRLSGGDRYATSVAVDESVFPFATTAFVASGINYPDALSGAAWAGAAHEPLYLSQPTCVPTSVAGSLMKTGVSSLTLLGGTQSLGSGVASMALC